jgi:multidrug efflux pump
VLNAALAHPGKILLAAVVLLVGVQVAYSSFGKGVEFFPDVEPEIAKLQVRARGNMSWFERDALMRQVEARIQEMDEFATVYARTGVPERSEEAEDIIGTITLEFVFWENRRPASEILADDEGAHQ